MILIVVPGVVYSICLYQICYTWSTDKYNQITVNISITKHHTKETKDLNERQKSTVERKQMKTLFSAASLSKIALIRWSQ